MITKIAILGGGLTGLTLANLLKSYDIRVIEKEKECGGLCRSIHENGYTFDLGGSHVIFSKDEEILKFIKKLLGNNITEKRRNAKILYKGRLIKYPFENGLYGLTKKDNLECLLGFVGAYFDNRTKYSNFEEWMYRTFGSGIVEKYLSPYNKKIWKLDPDKISTCWIKDRVPQPSIKDVIKASVGLESEGYTHQLNFYYPIEGGIYALIYPLEKNVQNRIILNFEINRIEKIEDGWSIYNGSKYIKCREIISTIPLFDIIYALKNVPVSVLDALKELRYNSLIIIMIGLNSPSLHNISWLYMHESACLSHRVSFPSNYTDRVVPTDKSSILAEITHNGNDNISRLSDDNIIENVINYLDQNKLINKNDVEFAKVKHIKYGYVVNDLNYEKNVKTIRDYLRKIGIHIVGRFSEWEYYNMDACIRSAMNFVSESCLCPELRNNDN